MASLDERTEYGRSLRQDVPRSSHAEFTRNASFDSSGLVLSQEKGRLPLLIPVRRKRMAESAFAFYRAGALLMTTDLKTTPRTGLPGSRWGRRQRRLEGTPKVLSGTEATACLVDVTDFKSDEGARVPWRVRFPSASATDSSGVDSGTILPESTPDAYSSRPMRGSAPVYMLSIWSPSFAMTARRLILSDGVSIPFSGVNSSFARTKSRTRS